MPVSKYEAFLKAAELGSLTRAAAELGVSPFFLGNGSNLLVADEGFDGFVVKTGGLDQVREVNGRLRAESGIPLARLAAAAREAILQKKSLQEYRSAQASLARAVSRLRVKQNAGL